MPVKSNRNGRKNTIYQQTNNVSYDGQPQLDADDGHDGDERPGHTRSPVFAREPTMLESFSRTVRNYVPSSIPIPAAAPSPPTVSRPFITSTSLSSPGLFDDAPPSGLAQAMHRSTTGADSILWARWDALQARRLLILGYSSGLQVWDCTNLGSVVEVLNLNEFPDVATFAAVLPGHNALGILTSEFNFLVYSLASHDIIKRIPLSTPAYTFTANHEFIVIVRRPDWHVTRLLTLPSQLRTHLLSKSLLPPRSQSFIQSFQRHSFHSQKVPFRHTPSSPSRVVFLPTHPCRHPRSLPSPILWLVPRSLSHPQPNL